MKELMKLDIDNETLLNMQDINKDILDIKNSKVKEMIDILKLINCNNKMIVNIITSNPLYLSYDKIEVLNLLKYLIDKGFSEINTMLDANPYILNLDIIALDDYLKNCNKDIIIKLIENPYLFNEI